LVLERPYKGLVFTVSSRFYVHIEELQKHKEETIQLMVVSCQFRRKQHFVLNFKNLQFHLDPVASKEAPNPYVESTITNTLNIIYAMYKTKWLFEKKLAHGLFISIVGDNDFYSQQYQVNKTNKHTSDAFYFTYNSASGTRFVYYNRILEPTT
jgi:hypothetical protein